MEFCVDLEEYEVENLEEVAAKHDVEWSEFNGGYKFEGDLINVYETIHELVGSEVLKEYYPELREMYLDI